MNFDFISEILSGTTPANSVKAWIVFIIGLAIYFILEYKGRSTTDPFSFLVWLKQNILNLLVSFLIAILYNLSAEVVVSSTLFLIAFGGNWLIDVLLTWRYYNQHPERKK